MIPAMIAKAVLGSIGGAFEGAAKPYVNGVKTEGVNPNSTDSQKNDVKAEEAREANKSLQQWLDRKNALNETNAGSTFNLQDKFKVDSGDTSKAFGMNINNIGSALGSDERLKEIYGDSISDRILEDFAKIAAIDFTYNSNARELYGNTNGVDDKEHTGVKAQDLESQESTKSVVEEDENGYKTVDTQQLTMTNTAAISELSRRVLELEEKIKILEAK
jgi:hypothetical protein